MSYSSLMEKVPLVVWSHLRMSSSWCIIIYLVLNSLFRLLHCFVFTSCSQSSVVFHFHQLTSPYSSFEYYSTSYVLLFQICWYIFVISWFSPNFSLCSQDSFQKWVVFPWWTSHKECYCMRYLSFAARFQIADAFGGSWFLRISSTFKGMLYLRVHIFFHRSLAPFIHLHRSLVPMVWFRGYGSLSANPPSYFFLVRPYHDTKAHFLSYWALPQRNYLNMLTILAHVPFGSTIPDNW